MKINEEPEKDKDESNEKKDILGSSMGQIFSKIINIGKEVVNKTKELNSEKLWKWGSKIRKINRKK